MNEPTTVLTDYLLAALGLVLAWRLSRSGSPPPVSRRLWAASFLALAVAALVGGTWHGIPPDALPSFRYHLWSITYATIGLADLLIVAGAARAALPRGPRAVALVLLTGGFLAYAALILVRHDFLYVGLDYLGTLLFLFVFGLDLVRRGEPGAGFVLAGVAASCAGSLVQYLRIAPHPQFNDNDLFHVLQMAGVWLFFRGGLRLRDR